MSLRRKLHRRHEDEDLAQEIASHLAHEQDDNLARGIPPGEAARLAHLKLGSPRRVREEIWQGNGVPWMEKLIRDLSYACRTLRRNPGYAALVILTLGLGIGANIAIFTVIRGVLLRPLPYADSSRIVRLDQVAARLAPDPLGLSVQEIRDYREQTHVFSDIAELHSMTFTLLGTQNPERVVTGVVSANFFAVLGVQPLLGRLLAPSDELPNAAPVLVLSYAYWMKEFGGDPHVLGRHFALNDRVHTVVGVLPSLPEYPDADEVYMPTTSCPFRSSPEMIANRESRMLSGFARLRPGITLEQARADLGATTRRLMLAYPKFYPSASGFDAQITPIQQELTHAARPAFFTLLAAAGLVLLLACANLANLALSRQLRRAREMAIRMATGASAWNILRQLLTESLLVALVGGLLGLILAAAGSRLLILYAARMTPLSTAIHLDWGVLFFGLGISLLAGVLFGALPAYVATRVRITSLADSGERTAGSESGTRARNTLVAVQVTLSFVLLVCAGLTLRSLYKLLSIDPGFKTANVLSMKIDLNWTRYNDRTTQRNFFEQTLAREQALPGVESAAISMMVPLNSNTGPMSGGVLFDGRPLQPGEPAAIVDYEVASPDYFRVLGVPVLSGRTFLDSDAQGAPPVVVVNDRLAAHYWPHQDPMGHRISTDEGKTWATVVGVVSSVHQYGLDKEREEALYFPAGQVSLTGVHLLVRTRADPLAMTTQITGVIHQVDPQQPVTEIRTLDQLRSAQLGTPRVTALLLGLFAAIALFITVVGVSGTLALAVSRRAREIGIRLALGAPRENILRNVLVRGMLPVFAGVAVGAVLSIFAARLLTRMLFSISPDDPATFLSIAAMLLLVALAGCAVPARRAIHIDPASTLRSE